MCRGYRKRSDFWIILFENVVALAKMLKYATTKRSVTYFVLGSGKCKLCAVFLVNPRVSLVLVPTFFGDNSGASKDKLMAPWKHN